MRRMTTIDLSQDNGGKVFVCRTLRMSQVATGTHRLPRNRGCTWSITTMLQLVPWLGRGTWFKVVMDFWDSWFIYCAFKRLWCLWRLSAIQVLLYCLSIQWIEFYYDLFIYCAFYTLWCLWRLSAIKVLLYCVLFAFNCSMNWILLWFVCCALLFVQPGK